MSLINDALKKAQRQRTNNPFGIDAPMPGGGGRPARRGSGMPTQTIVLIAAGCALLVVISAVGAVFFVNGKSTPKPAAAVVATTSVPASSTGSASTKTEFPALELQPITISVKNEPPPIAVAPAPVQPSAATSVVTTTSKSESTAPEAKAPTAKPAATSSVPTVAHAQDERVHAYLDELRVTAVRVAGAGSRVRLNEKVYRVSDTVDRTLNLKLTTVENDFLLFTDANGVEYRKNF